MTGKTTLYVLGMVLAGLCLMRVLSVAASEDVEVYSATSHSADEEAIADDEEIAAKKDYDENRRAEIRISRPDEAADRIADQGYDMVPGLDRLHHVEQLEHNRALAADRVVVPQKSGRTIASESVSAPAPGGQLQDGMESGVIEPKPFTTADAKERASEIKGDSLVVSNTQPGKAAYGLKAEPPVTASSASSDAPPATTSTARVGYQEISVIVDERGFYPNRIFVTQNIPVKMYLTTPAKTTTCFMLDDWGVKKGVAPGKVEEITFTPNQFGDYRFYCPVKSIEGRLTVKEAQTVQSMRGVASEMVEEPKIGHRNEPKNAALLRSLIEE